jgi:Holliday junction resolvasome RuvABC ATP-dependent DNA helicase subunit
MDSENFEFNSLGELITVVHRYKQNRRKRGRGDWKIPYNVDMERLLDCLIPLEKLDDLIGMEDIKKNIIDQVLFYAQDLNTNEMMHTCLTGPPGVGKTTIGKILAELYCSMGFLKTDNFRVVSRPDFIAGYLGQTALKTERLLKKSLGGVLFVDEAYSLGTHDDGFSKECIDTINKFLSENTSDFIMIIAGYKEELDRYFFSANKGLKRRFSWVYDIKKYTPDNLVEIFKYQVYTNEWFLDDEVTSETLKNIFNQNNFEDNGGDTLLLFDKSKISHSRRVFGKSKKIKRILNMIDIEKGFELMKKQKTKETKAPPYGMYV